MADRTAERVTAVIATLNEAPSVAEVVRGVLRHVSDVLVVDGGSDDGTQQAAAEAGARVVTCSARGKGRALRQVIDSEEAHILLFIDADGSHDPDDIPQLVAPIVAGEADLVVGCRMTGGSDELEHDPGHRIRALGTHVLQFIVDVRFGVRLTDMQNGYRAIRTAVARELRLREPRFCIEQEMVIQCLRRGYRVLNVPSHEHHRRHGRSKIRVWAEWPRYVGSVLALCALPRVRRREREAGSQ
jgi:dolichol-phosphate mannosyltransferase